MGIRTSLHSHIPVTVPEHIPWAKTTPERAQNNVLPCTLARKLSKIWFVVRGFNKANIVPIQMVIFSLQILPNFEFVSAADISNFPLFDQLFAFLFVIHYFHKLLVPNASVFFAPGLACLCQHKQPQLTIVTHDTACALRELFFQGNMALNSAQSQMFCSPAIVCDHDHRSSVFYTIADAC